MDGEKINWLINFKPNGCKIKNILIGEKNDIIVPYEYEFIEFKFNEIEKILNFYYKYSDEYNIILDDRMIYAISYLSFYFDDLIIFDTLSNKNITFFSFVNKLLFNNQIRILDRNKLNNILFTYSIIKFKCPKININWKIEYILESVKKINNIKFTYNINLLLMYLQNLNTKYLRNYKIKDIKLSFLVKDSNKELEINDKHQLLMELLYLKENNINHLCII